MYVDLSMSEFVFASARDFKEVPVVISVAVYADSLTDIPGYQITVSVGVITKGYIYQDLSPAMRKDLLDKLISDGLIFNTYYDSFDKKLQEVCSAAIHYEYMI